jgi:hypothetical protein
MFDNHTYIVQLSGHIWSDNGNTHRQWVALAWKDGLAVASVEDEHEENVLMKLFAAMSRVYPCFKLISHVERVTLELTYCQTQR